MVKTMTTKQMTQAAAVAGVVIAAIVTIVIATRGGKAKR